VLDVQLEGGTGLEVLQAVRRADPSVAFVVLSNNSAPAYRKRYLAEGASRFLDKSTEFGALAQAVADAADHRAH
jgi:DNA-binding NarL/FixJ family response regulator